MTDPLIALWELFDGMNVMDQPPLAQEEPATVEGPDKGSTEHPIIVQRKEVDDLRATGMEDTDAHQQMLIYSLQDYLLNQTRSLSDTFLTFCRS